MGTGTANQVRDVLHPIPSTTSAGAEPEGRSRIVQMGNQIDSLNFKTYTNG